MGLCLNGTISLLSFCIILLSIIGRRMWKSQTIIVDLSTCSVLSVFASFILKLCYEICKHLRMLCLLELTLFVFGSVCFEINFTWNLIFHCFIFNLFVSLYLDCFRVTYNWSLLFRSGSLFLLIGMFRTFTFNGIIVCWIDEAT